MSGVLPTGRTVILTDTGTIAYDVALATYDGTPTPTPTPTPVFTTPSSIVSDGTPQVGEQLSGADGSASNSISYTRRWLLGSTVLATSNQYTPATTGVHRFEVTATGAGGTATSYATVTVAGATPAPTPTPTPTPTPSPTLSQPSISPISGTVGQTFTATDGTVTNGALTSRRWLLGTTAIGTGTTVVPNGAGSLTLENTATGTNGTVITATSNSVIVSAAAPTPAPSLSLSSAVTQAEGNSGTASFVWSLALNRDGSTAAHPYSWAVTGSGSNAANAADFGGSLPSGSGTFAAGETSKSITVLVAGDTAIEPNETFTLTVTASGLNTVTSTGTISNDDTASVATFDSTTSSFDSTTLTFDKAG